MQKDDTIRLRHKLDAAMEAIRFTESETRDSLDKDKKLVLALVKCIEIVGEAAPKRVEVTCEIIKKTLEGSENVLVSGFGND